MKLLLVSATSAEIAPTLDFLDIYKIDQTPQYQLNQLLVSVCVTGVGMVNTAFELGKLQSNNFEVAINAGVAGTFSSSELGKVVSVSRDCFSELGAQDHKSFLRIDEMGFGTQDVEIKKTLRSQLIDELPKVKGITVNTVHGEEESIRKIIASHQPEIESMEGAAFVHAANAHGWTALQLRAISNKVEKRNKENWKLADAIKNLNNILINILQELSQKA